MKHNLNEIKNDYQNIPVPEDLKARVEGAIAQAKADYAKTPDTSNTTVPFPAKKCSVSSIRRYVLGGLGGVAAAALAITILANSNAAVAHAMGQIPVLGAIVKVVTFREYQHSENQMQADLKIPEVQVKDPEGNVLEAATGNLNENIQKYTDEIIASYEADVKAAGGEGVEELNLDYDIVTDNSKLFSLRFQQSLIAASGNETQKIYHVDKTTGEMITLKDLFQQGADYQTPISENIKTQMKQQMQEDENKIYWVNSDMEEFNFTQISDQVNFYVNESGKLVIVFNEYEVAPGYMGVVTFEIPTEVVKDIVKDGYLM